VVDAEAGRAVVGWLTHQRMLASLRGSAGPGAVEPAGRPAGRASTRWSVIFVK